MKNYLLQLGAEEAYQSHNKAFGMVDDFQRKLSRVVNSEIPHEELFEALDKELNAVMDEMRVGHKWLCALKE